jgi:hypothetical protein
MFIEAIVIGEKSPRPFTGHNQLVPQRGPTMARYMRHLSSYRTVNRTGVTTALDSGLY